jgi:hypothetical protein
VLSVAEILFLKPSVHVWKDGEETCVWTTLEHVLQPVPLVSDPLQEIVIAV